MATGIVPPVRKGRQLLSVVTQLGHGVVVAAQAVSPGAKLTREDKMRRAATGHRQQLAGARASFLASARAAGAAHASSADSLGTVEMRSTLTLQGPLSP